MLVVVAMLRVVRYVVSGAPNTGLTFGSGHSFNIQYSYLFFLFEPISPYQGRFIPGCYTLNQRAPNPKQCW